MLRKTYLSMNFQWFEMSRTYLLDELIKIKEMNFNLKIWKNTKPSIVSYYGVSHVPGLGSWRYRYIHNYILLCCTLYVGIVLGIMIGTLVSGQVEVASDRNNNIWHGANQSSRIYLHNHNTDEEYCGHLWRDRYIYLYVDV